MYIDESYIWLAEHCKGWQFGEQGVLKALCERKGITRGIEIGAGDGTTLPVTLSFLPDLTLYEIESDRQDKLRKLYPKATILGEYTGEDLPDDSCVVVDVDSFDCSIAEKVTSYGKPAIMMVEHYDLEGPGVQDAMVPDWLIGLSLANHFRIQQPLAVVRALMESRGYTLVAVTRVNGIYVYEEEQ
jgi:hypothetical protein